MDVLPLSFLRLKPGIKLTSVTEWSIVGKRTTANTTEKIMKKVQEIMPGVLSSNLEKVNRMTHLLEVFYYTQYGKVEDMWLLCGVWKGAYPWRSAVLSL